MAAQQLAADVARSSSVDARESAAGLADAVKKVAVRSAEKDRTSSCSFADRIARASIDTFRALLKHQRLEARGRGTECALHLLRAPRRCARHLGGGGAGSGHQVHATASRGSGCSGQAHSRQPRGSTAASTHAYLLVVAAFGRFVEQRHRPC
eukprot:scaffold7335_cov417-Prasinococcus_capsulatus_cf.AAC.7